MNRHVQAIAAVPPGPIPVVLLAATMLAPVALHAQTPTGDFVPVTDAMLQDPAPGDWPMWRRSLDSWGYSPLDQIRPGERRFDPHGLVPGDDRRHAAGYPAGVRRRDVHAEPERRHPGARRGDRRSPLGAPARPPRRPRRSRAGTDPHQPQPRHPRPVHHRHERRRLRLRPRRGDGGARLGDRDPRLPHAPGTPVVGPDHRGRQGHLGAAAASRSPARRGLRRHRPRRGDRRRAVAAPADSGPRRARRRDLGRRCPSRSGGTSGPGWCRATTPN